MPRKRNPLYSHHNLSGMLESKGLQPSGGYAMRLKRPYIVFAKYRLYYGKYLCPQLERRQASRSGSAHEALDDI